VRAAGAFPRRYAAGHHRLWPSGRDPPADNDRHQTRSRRIAERSIHQGPPKWIAAIRQLLQMGVRAGEQALAKWGLNYVIEDYLQKKLSDESSFLP